MYQNQNVLKKCACNHKLCCHGQFCLFVFWFLIAMVIGLFPTTIAPAIIGQCPANNIVIIDSAPTGVCTENGFYGHSIATVYDGMQDAFETLVFHDYDLINKAREYEGNEFYDVIQSNSNNTQYLWFEHWTNIESVTNWVYKGQPSIVFKDPAVIAMLVGGQLDITSMTGYSRKESCNLYDYNLGSVRFSISNNTGCDLLWDDISNVTNCMWIKDCTQVTNVITDPDTGYTSRVIVYDDGETLQQTITLIANTIHQIEYFVKDFSAIIQIDTNNNGNGCDVFWSFNATTNYQQSLQEIYSTFYETTIPYLQTIYQ